ERVVARTEVDVQRRDVEVVDAALASRELGRSGERRGVDGLDAGRASRALESDDKTVAVLGYRDIARMRLGRIRVVRIEDRLQRAQQGGCVAAGRDRVGPDAEDLQLEAARGPCADAQRLDVVREGRTGGAVAARSDRDVDAGLGRREQ